MTPTAQTHKGLISFTESATLGASNYSAGITTTQDMIVNFINFSVVSINSNGTTGDADKPLFSGTINKIPAFTLAMPRLCSDAQGLVAMESFKITDFFLPKGSIIQVYLRASSVGGNGYASSCTFGVSGVAI